MNYCILIPHYNHERQFSTFLPVILALGLPCIVVDDGSSEESLRMIKEAIGDHPQVLLVEHGRNRGKGAAVITGFYAARAQGFTHAIQIDADGQHCASDIKKFIAVSQKSPESLICGKPVFDESVPKIRYYGRKITGAIVILETLSFTIKDGLCGFRVYPLTSCERILDNYFVGSRMDFDPEILVKAVWAGVQLEFVNTKVIYPEASVSHFHYLRDNWVQIRLHVRLLLMTLVMLPKLIFRKFKVRRSE